MGIIGEVNLALQEAYMNGGVRESSIIIEVIEGQRQESVSAIRESVSDDTTAHGHMKWEDGKFRFCHALSSKN